MRKIQILLVEDDLPLRQGYAEYLSLSGFGVTAVGTALMAFSSTARQVFNVAIVDLGLPDIDGQHVVKFLRDNSDARIIVLTADERPSTQTKSYDAGADLYMAKPANLEALVAAIKSLARRQDAQQHTAFKDDSPQWVLDDHSWELVSPQEHRMLLSNKEYLLFKAFAEGDQTALSREALCNLLYRRHDPSAEAALATLIKRVRQKLLGQGLPNPIRTIHGKGYLFRDKIRLS